ncbi:hypothetical protein ABE61_00620 [Lysinibacillus sphaericus]|nr:hypothetical protein [Lysinibacillus sphaericus]MBG9479115.1 hypothetical protein [Lysinibacillus sphaericus]MBG9591299.1 hypothetical protein [Lysinibacillus sphaericus]
MSISKTIGEIYNLPTPRKNDEYSLEQSYMEFYNKQIDDISTKCLVVVQMMEACSIMKCQSSSWPCK